MSEQEKPGLPKDVTDAAAAWFARRDVGHFTASDQAELDAWIAASPVHEAAWRRLDGLWGALGSTSSAEREPARANVSHWQKQRIRRKRAISGGAAACLLLLCFTQGQDILVRFRADAITGTGEQRAVRLADGSVAHLNTGSAIAVDYTPGQRSIRLLKGEAAFDVAGDASRPFVVQARGGTATALGTRYIVRLLDDATQVTVTQHKVAVRNAPGASAIVVRQGQTVRYSANGIGRAAAQDVRTAESWLRGKLIFENRPLAEVVREIGRYHPGMIRVLGKDAAARKISGVFPIGDPVAAINSIEHSFGLRSTRLTDRLIILHE